MRQITYAIVTMMSVFAIYWLGGGDFIRSFMLGFFTMVAILVGLFTVAITSTHN